MTSTIDEHDANKLPISRNEVQRLTQCIPGSRWDTPVDEAIMRGRMLLVPQSRWLTLTNKQLLSVFAERNPVLEIAQRGQAFAFVATIGAPLESTVKRLFQQNEYLAGLLLDAVGSVATEAVCDEVQARCVDDQSAVRFSPGYCGWPLTSQWPLLDLLNAADLGVQLLDSCLMTPLKSVSGIVVSAPGQTLQMPSEVCACCDAVGCDGVGGS
ncbi:MAG: hypothetical protein HN348_31070 [Proteobacteria bacterium]|jgi:hypothetical protein|nr:hypothetical protein [Pseudomonadota bacterium]